MDKFLATVETNLGTIDINKGIAEKQIEELVGFANHDPQVIKFTSDKVRFATKEKAISWLGGGKTVYTLSSKEQRLLGIIWFHPANFPKVKLTTPADKDKYRHTFAIRIYGEARGKGLVEQFMKVCFSDYQKKDIWLTVSYDNVPAVRAYRKFGFRQVSNPDREGKIVMVYQGAL